jgi:hypothetical protein
LSKSESRFPPLFLNDEELRILTGRSRKTDQVAQLRRMGILFRLNAAGKPVVTRAVIEGHGNSEQSDEPWQSHVIAGHQ